MMGERCGTCDSTLVKFGGYGKQCGVCGHRWMPRIDPKPPAATESDTSGGGEKKCELGCILEAPHTGTSCRGSFDPHNVGVLRAKAKADAKAATEERGEPEKPIQLETDVVKRIVHFRSLKKDWDSYGAEPIPDAVADLALVVVQRMAGGVHEITWAGPTNDEGIQLDTKSGMGIEVSRYGN
ncbi:hypothetical protein LCGC14_0251390 [marine sediment metagenome]|uniref:Uncharacterized protein n=1 Tax=marine sediment metagenome TaxID=412755 RepID=A0A0F9UKV3_9ZZZZ